MRSSVVNHGVYSIGDPPAGGGQTSFVVGAAGIAGRLGTAPIQWLGAYDLKPWQGAPPGWASGVTPTIGPVVPADLLGVADDFREAFFAVESGEASVRFTWQDDYPPIGNNLGLPGPPFSGVIGNRTLNRIWFNTQIQGAPPATTSCAVMPLLVCAADSLTELQSIWHSVRTLEWPTFGVTGGGTGPNAWNPIGQFPFTHASIGPDVLSDLAQGNTAEYDLRELAGGARFVAIWTGICWVGGGPNSWIEQLRFERFRWQVEDRPAWPRAAPVTYSYPIDRIQGASGAPAPPMAPPWIVAQWGARVHGTAVVSQPVWSVSVANGGEQLTADIGHAVGQQIDLLASNPQLIAPAVSNAQCSIVRMNQAPAAQFPYSYGLLSMEGVAATETGPAIVSVALA